MNTLQENKITDYLVSQNLSLDIQIEIKDHMIHQIMDLQLEENLSFEDAFSRVKESWKGEFVTTNYWMFFREPIPIIAKKVIREKYNRLLKKSFLIGLLFLGVNILLIYLANTANIYSILFKGLNGMFLLALATVWVLNFKIRQYMKPDFKYKGKCLYTMYQQNMGLMFLCALSMLQMIMRDGHYAYQFFREQDYTANFMMMITLLIPFLLQTGVIFTLLNFYEHKKNLLKMHDFLTPTTDRQ
ncbi:Uncharacterised protein [Chryseobacterium nakagawai]|uniref:Uncharacterized protein n=1 Tax=Chryseobacterium nakagawai TaxID=1241982 RepID=A0AAD0YL85_CHRNA|nr:hypothetical protein [Chryseobacterium nakagawai]AZA91305.1 hypothetical protein EG343_11990 [Chryseobacterium nakagawai]VEH22879.1 Uncharacterised protein [Chryseobacterium nakagawai]